MRLEVVLGEAAGAEVFPCIADRKNAAVLDRFEIRRIVGGPNPQVAVFHPTLAIVQLLTHQLGELLVQEPDADSLDAQGPGRLLAGHLHGRLEVVLDVLGQSQQRPLVTDDALGPLHENLLGLLAKCDLSDQVPVGGGQFGGSVLDAGLQLLVGVDERGVPLLDLLEHLVERFDQQADLIAAVLLGAYGVLPFLGDQSSHAGQMENRMRDDPLEPGGNQVRSHRRQRQDAQDRHGAAAKPLVQEIKIRPKADGADPLLVQKNRLRQREKSAAEHGMVLQLASARGRRPALFPNVRGEQLSVVGIDTGDHNGGDRLDRLEDLTGFGGVAERDCGPAIVGQNIGVRRQIADHSMAKARPFPGRQTQRPSGTAQPCT